MTEDYKKDLLNYITNNFSTTKRNDDQILQEITSIPRTNFVNYLPSTWTDLVVAGLIQSTTNGYFVIYGGYVPIDKTATEDSRGFIIITDNNLNPVGSIYKFTSGTNLRPIQKMIQIEDGTFVAFDSTVFALPENRVNIQSNEKRFIMLNNLSLKSNNEYVARLRTSYKIPTAYQNLYCIDMIKNPNSAHYLMAGATYIPKENNGHYDGVRVIDLKVNVGASNEWDSVASSDSVYWLYSGFTGTFNNDDDASWKLLLTVNVSNAVTFGWWDGTTYHNILNTEGDIVPMVDSIAMRNQAKFINYDTAYFVLNNQRLSPAVIPRYIGLYKYSFSSGSLKKIYLKNTGNYDYNDSREGIFLNTLNGDLYVTYCNNYNKDNSTANYNYQRLVNDEWNPILIGENEQYVMEKTITHTYNIYNLVSSIAMSQRMTARRWRLGVVKEIYNSFNYNGSSYTDYNSLIADTGNIYSNNDIVFARDLYNKTTLNNTTVSTLQVPNTMLNDINLNKQSLIGVTNVELVDNTEDVQKNIYETLFLNFINTINVIDEDTNTRFNVAANYVNENIEIGTKDSSINSSIGKVRINYGDNTTKKFNINWNIIDDTHRSIEYGIYVDKVIDSIDYLSNDETTIYCKKQLDLEVGNYYKIKQYLRME